jgi:hypothetical protein
VYRPFACRLSTNLFVYVRRIRNTRVYTDERIPIALPFSLIPLSLLPRPPFPPSLSSLSLSLGSGVVVKTWWEDKVKDTKSDNWRS